MTMKIYADPITVNCRKVLAGLDLIGVPFERIHVDYFQGEQKNDSYVAINPNASLPAMIDGDFVLWESNAILQYAADKTGNVAVYPRDPQTRADINRWMFWERQIRRYSKPSRPSSTSSPVSSIIGSKVATGSSALARRLLTLRLLRRCICMAGRSSRLTIIRVCENG